MDASEEVLEEPVEARNDVTAEVRLNRFLHYASEDSTYLPGSRFALKCYKHDKLTCVAHLLEEKKGNYIINTVKKVYEEKSSVFPEAGLFVLAHCSLQSNASSSLKADIYRLAEKIIIKPEQLFLFVKFLKEGKDPSKARSGRGVKRLIQNWYLKKNALDLAEIVLMTPKYRGWTHCDLIRLSHLKSQEPAKKAIILYAVKGIEEVKSRFSDVAEAKEVVIYLTTVDAFRKTKDVEKVARLIDSYSLTVKHVNSCVISNKEVWTSLLRQISLLDLLDYFQLISRNKLFRSGRTWDSDFVRSVCDTMGNPASVSESGIHPSRVFLELYKYKNLAKMKVEMASKAVPVIPGARAKHPPQVNQDIITGLSKLLRSSFKNVSATKKRYLIAVEGFENMKATNCGWSRFVPPLYAAAIIILTLLKVEKKVEVVTFSQSSNLALEPVAITQPPEVDTIVTSLLQTEKGRVDMKKLFSFAKKKQKEVDVFIVIGSYLRLPSYNIINEELNKYGEVTKIHNSKVVMCSLRGLSKSVSQVDHPRALLLTGFDANICKLIEAFVNNHF